MKAKQHRRIPRRGFTLMELLVSIAVIALLIALLLPAVQQAREAARKTQCRSNLKQLALAMNNYHDSFGMLPINTSYTHDVGPLARSRSWSQGILPYIEQTALSNQIDPSASVQASLFLAEVGIAVFLCPSDRSDGQVQFSGGLANFRSDMPDDWILGATNYKACSGSNWQYGDFANSSSVGRFPSSEDGLNQGNGIICAGFNVPVTTRLQDITDGVSNTFFLGEAVVGWTKWSWWYYSNGSTGTCAIPLNYMAGRGAQQANLTDWQNNYGFMSRHAGGGHFAFGDGRVHFLSEEIDLKVYRDLATIQGGEVISEY